VVAFFAGGVKDRMIETIFELEKMTDRQSKSVDARA